MRSSMHIVSLLFSIAAAALAEDANASAPLGSMPYPFVGAWRGHHGHAVGLCTAELIAPEWVVTAGHCAVRMLKHEKVDVQITFSHSKGPVKRGVAECIHADRTVDLAICRLNLPISSRVIAPAPVSADLFRSGHPMNMKQAVKCIGTKDGFHIVGPKHVIFTKAGDKLYVDNSQGSGMHAGDSGGAWVATVMAPAENGTKAAAEVLVGVIHGGEGKGAHRKGVAVQPSFVKEFIDQHTKKTVNWIHQA